MADAPRKGPKDVARAEESARRRESFRDRCEQRVRESRDAILHSKRVHSANPAAMLAEIIADERMAGGLSPGSAAFAASLARSGLEGEGCEEAGALNLDLSEDERLELLLALERLLYGEEDERAERQAKAEEEELAALVRGYEHEQWGMEEEEEGEGGQ